MDTCIKAARMLNSIFCTARIISSSNYPCILYSFHMLQCLQIVNVRQ